MSNGKPPLTAIQATWIVKWCISEVSKKPVSEIRVDNTLRMEGLIIQDDVLNMINEIVNGDRGVKILGYKIKPAVLGGCTPNTLVADVSDIVEAKAF